MTRGYGYRFVVVFASFFFLAPFVYPANRPLPEDVNVKAFAKQDADRLVLLVRIPLTAVKDIQFPTLGDTGYLDLNTIKSMLPGASRYWIADCFEVFQKGVAAAKPEIVKTRISLSSDPSFDSYQGALADFNAPDPPADTSVSPDQVWLDIRFEYPLTSNHPSIAIRPKLASLGVRVSTDMKYVGPDGDIRDFTFDGDPGLIYLDAGWVDATKQFLQWGVRLTLTNIDFLLFLFCLALPLRRYWAVTPAVAAFAGALSVTLLASGIGLMPDAIWLRPLIETLSAISILWVALANIMGHVTPRRRALLALTAGFVFGFVCLLEFSGKVQFGGSYPIVSVLAYDAGTVLAIAFLTALLVPVSSVLFRSAKSERVEMIVISALAADTAWGWLEERWAELSKVPFHAPTFDANFLALALRCLTVLVLFGGLLWFADDWLKTRHFPPDDLSPKDKDRTPV